MKKSKIILPLDVDSLEKAVSLVDLLKDSVGAFKVGLELVNVTGIGVFDAIRKAGAHTIFYDCKFHDIPNTVAGASRAVAKMGVWMFNLHCSGGYDMMKAAKEASLEAANELGVFPPKVIGVTVLTSISQEVLNHELNIQGHVEDQTLKMAALAQKAGLDGVVASPHEIEVIRRYCGPEFMIVTPGVRPEGSALGDQKRVMTPHEAMQKGADYLVIGRPIIKAEDPKAAATIIAQEM